VRGLRSAVPNGAGKVVKSTIRKRRRVTLEVELLVNVLRIVMVPKVELFAGSDSKSRTKLGGENGSAAGSSSVVNMSGETKVATLKGLDRFSGDGAPSRWPAPALVPLVSTNMKSLELLSVSWGRPEQVVGTGQ
jgi:hypothetical protein